MVPRRPPLPRLTSTLPRPPRRSPKPHEPRGSRPSTPRDLPPVRKQHFHPRFLFLLFSGCELASDASTSLLPSSQSTSSPPPSSFPPPPPTTHRLDLSPSFSPSPPPSSASGELGSSVYPSLLPSRLSDRRVAEYLFVPPLSGCSACLTTSPPT